MWRPKLSRDLLNLALILAFLHIDPESYLGFGSNPGSIMGQNKILDDLNIFGRFSDQFFDFDQNPLEISAYVLNAENSPNFNNLLNSAVNNNPENPENEQMDQDSGVSDVDSGNQSDEDNLSSIFQNSNLNSPANLGDDLESDEWILRSEQVKIEDDTRGHENRSQLEIASYNGIYETEDSSNIFRDLDDIIGTATVVDSPDLKTDDLEFSPDQEDVENQLMHIDDQLIRLDENIEDITDHLDEQLLNTATVVENEALLTQEEENLLFSSMPEVMDPMQNWQNLETSNSNNQEIDELIAAGLPSPLMPFMVAVDADQPKNITTGENPVVKTEVKEEPIDDESQLYNGHEADLNWLEPYMSPPLSPSESLASSFLPSDLLSSEDERTPSHLLDHDYALSAFDEDCFSSEIASSLSQKTLNSDFYGGASALAGQHFNRPSKDERKAKELNLPFAVGDIVDLPIDAFNELVSRHTLTEEQMALCRDIRRRGKNKVAAQNCRKRKNDLISQLEADVNRARQQKQELLAERAELYKLRNEWTHKLLNLESAVRRGLELNSNDFAFDYSGSTVEVTRLAKAKA